MLHTRRPRLFAVVLAQSVALIMTLSNAHPSFSAAPLVKPTSGVAQQKTAAQVLQTIIDAYGGAEKLKEHRQRPMKSHGTIESSSGISTAVNSYECDVLEKGDKVRVEMTLLGVPMIVGFDGKGSWQQYGDWVAPASASTSDMLSEELKHGLPALSEALDPKAKIELLPSQSTDGKVCDVLKVTTADNKTTTFFADPTSHLIVRADYEGTDHELGTKATQSIRYEDYRPVAGSKEPFRILHYTGNRKKSETIVKSIDADVVIDDKAFQMPPESEIARLKDGPIILPFEYSGNEIVIKARINGGNEGRFIVDTGASQSVIDKRAASALGSHPVSTFSITTGSKAVPLSYTKLPMLGMGDLTLMDIPVLVTDLSNVAEKPTGLIGANILKRFLVTIDYEDKKLILADPRSVTVPPSAISIPTKPVFGGTALIVKGQLDDKSAISFLVDTGASFNNLPQSLAKTAYAGPILSVGSIYGLDGQKVGIGTWRAKSLKIGSLNVQHPVFTVAPDRNPTHAGLFTASSMGILGNPIWSQFKTTVDYRNERLILEPPAGYDKYLSLRQSLEKADADYLRSHNADDALKAYEKILVTAQVDQQKQIEALAIDRLAGCYADKFLKTKEAKWLELSTHEYERASKVAYETRNRNIEGQVLADWALMYLNAPRSYNDITVAQNLLTKALQKAPMEPVIYAAFGTTLLRVGKKAEAEKLIDRALVLDPSNWQALWAKHKLLTEQKNMKDATNVVQQLQYYYPNFPEVTSLLPKEAKPHVASLEPKPSASTATKSATAHGQQKRRKH